MLQRPGSAHSAPPPMSHAGRIEYVWSECDVM
jgi:hypothetical protein